MKMTPADEKTVQAWAALLEEGTENLTPRVQARLLEARRLAMAGSTAPRRPWLSVPRWLASGGLSVAAAVTLAISLWIAVPDGHGPVPDRELAHLDMQEQLELYEDLEFYRWLAAHRAAE